MTDVQAMELAMSHHRAGQLDQAEAIYRQVLAQYPSHAEALHMLGMLVHQRGQPGLAADLMILAVQANPNIPRYYNNLGLVLTALNRLDEAVAALQSAARMSPDVAEIYNNLGNALTKKHAYEQAVAAFQRAVLLSPSEAELHHNLGNALKDLDRLEEAAVAFRKATRIKPGLFKSQYMLGMTLQTLGDLDEALAAFKAAQSLSPDLALPLTDIGNVLRQQGRLGEAIDAYRSAQMRDPTNSIIAGNLLYMLHYHPDYDAAAIYREHARWQAQFAEPLKKLIRPHVNDHDPERRLRIGYVSPNFRDHVVGRNLVPLFKKHDHGQFEIVSYSISPRADSLTDFFRVQSDQWREASTWPEQRLADQIREDKIDILVDLALHLDENKLLVFAQKPAPVQVTFAGYPASTGLDTIDYRLTDPFLDPPGGNDEVYSEKSLRLLETFWCFDPLGDDLAVNSLPAKDTGCITFGCMNNYSKVNDRVLELWARVLQAAPTSRFLIMSNRGSHRQRMLDVLGVEPQRVLFLQGRLRPEYLKRYHLIDIALDTFPYNGHTTSLDAMWMGVPTVTLVGSTAVGRAGWSQLSNIGLTELAAHSPDEYVKIATELASDLPRLSELRSTLRQRMQDSPLMDARKFAHNIENAYRTIWREWCMG